MNLTNLANVKAWLAIPTNSTADDALLTNLITNVSQFILNWLDRPNLVKTTFTETRSGTGQTGMMLRNWPVLAVSSLNIGRNPIPTAQYLGGNGYTLSNGWQSRAGAPQSVELTAYTFVQANNNVQVVYEAGYCIQNEPATIPASPGPYTVKPQAFNGPWSQDDGVNYASGAAFVPVAASPTVGQYTVVQDPVTGIVTYTFNAADAAAAILLNYSYVPADLEQVAKELVGERYKYKPRIGQKSVSEGGQISSSYSIVDLQPYQKTSLMPYRNAFAI